MARGQKRGIKQSDETLQPTKQTNDADLSKTPKSQAWREPEPKKRLYQRDWFHLTAAVTVAISLFVLMRLYPAEQPKVADTPPWQKETERIARLSPYQRCIEASFQTGAVSGFGIAQVERACIKYK